MLNNWLVFCDGGSRGNPGKAAIGVVIYRLSIPFHQLSSLLVKTQNIKPWVEFGKQVGVLTNNQAEYQAVIEALRFLHQHSVAPKQLAVMLDSLLVAKQLLGKYKIKKAHLANLYQQVKYLETLLHIKPIYLNIPRWKNQRADALLNQALDS